MAGIQRKKFGKNKQSPAKKIPATVTALEESEKTERDRRQKVQRNAATKETSIGTKLSEKKQYKVKIAYSTG